MRAVLRIGMVTLAIMCKSHLPIKLAAGIDTESIGTAGADIKYSEGYKYLKKVWDRLNGETLSPRLSSDTGYVLGFVPAEDPAGNAVAGGKSGHIGGSEPTGVMELIVL